MPKPFTDSRKRIDRAIMHAKAFADEWARVGDSKGYTFGEKKEDERTFVFSLIPHPNIVENSLALELGEFFYQLRSALDSAMWYACTLAHGSDPPPNVENRIEFPIYPYPRPFKDAPFHGLKFPKELSAWLETMQPYSANKVLNNREAFVKIVLERIHNGARKDRHRKLHIVVAAVTEVEYRFLCEPPAKIKSVEGIVCNALEDESDFLRVCIEAEPLGTVGQKVGLASTITTDISCDEVPAYGSAEMVLAFREMVRTVEFVVERFEAAF